MPRYRLRTLLIVLALGPPLLAWVWFNARQLVFVAFLCGFLLAIGLIANALILSFAAYLLRLLNNRR